MLVHWILWSEPEYDKKMKKYFYDSANPNNGTGKFRMTRKEGKEKISLSGI